MMCVVDDDDDDGGYGYDRTIESREGPILNVAENRKESESGVIESVCFFYVGHLWKFG